MIDPHDETPRDEAKDRIAILRRRLYPLVPEPPEPDRSEEPF